MGLQGLFGVIDESPRNINYKGYMIDKSEISVTNYINQYIVGSCKAVNETSYKYIGDITEDYYRLTSSNSKTNNNNELASK